MMTLITTISTNADKVAELEAEKLNFIVKMAGIFIAILVINFVIDWVVQRPKKLLQKNHSLKQMKVNALRKELEGKLEKRVDAKKRYQVELMCAQAGMDIYYGSYALTCLITATILPLIIASTMQNYSLALVCIPLGYMIPGQIIETIKNKRLGRLYQQVNSFMELFGERYKTVKSPGQALEDTLLDFEGVQPIQYEIQKTLLDVKLNTAPVEALEKMAERTGHIYLDRMVSYLKIAENIGTDGVRENLIHNAVEQGRKNESRRNKLKARIAGAKNTSMLLWFAVPGVMIYQSMTTDDYVKFMFGTNVGKYGLTFIVCALIGILWFINKKIAAPIE